MIQCIGTDCELRFVFPGCRFSLENAAVGMIDDSRRKRSVTMRMWKKLLGISLLASSLLVTGCGGDSAMSGSTSNASGDTVKVGLLHSLSGTMAISETSVRDAEKLAIQEINDQGGVLGKKIEIVEEDGASDPQIFSEKAKKLLMNDKVATIFGCWTSASRKAVKPVVESSNGLLWYPTQYEGMEQSKNIMYMGAAPNQQIVPAIEYLLKNGKKKMFLVGSDYVFPQTANRIIKAQLAAQGGEVIGEEYTPMGYTDYATIISKIKAAKPDVIVNTLNGDSNVAFFKQLKDAGVTAEACPVMSFSIAEEEIKGIGAENIAGDLVSWTTTRRPKRRPTRSSSLPTRRRMAKTVSRMTRLKPLTMLFISGRQLLRRLAASMLIRSARLPAASASMLRKARLRSMATTSICINTCASARSTAKGSSTSSLQQTRSSRTHFSRRMTGPKA